MKGESIGRGGGRRRRDDAGGGRRLAHGLRALFLPASTRTDAAFFRRMKALAPDVEVCSTPTTPGPRRSSARRRPLSRGTKVLPIDGEAAAVIAAWPPRRASRPSPTTACRPRIRASGSRHLRASGRAQAEHIAPARRRVTRWCLKGSPTDPIYHGQMEAAPLFERTGRLRELDLGPGDRPPLDGPGADQARQRRTGGRVVERRQRRRRERVARRTGHGRKGPAAAWTTVAALQLCCSASRPRASGATST